MNEQLENSEYFNILDMTISVKMNNDEILIGEIYFYNCENGVLILKENNSDGNKFNLRYINSEAVKEFKIVKIKDNDKIKGTGDLVDFRALLKKEEEFMMKAKYNDMMNEKGISENDVKIFEFFSKTYDKTVWDGNNILIPNLNIKINQPFKPENVEGALSQSVERIKKMVVVKFHSIE